MKGFKKVLSVIIAAVVMLLPLQVCVSALDEEGEVIAAVCGIAVAIDSNEEIQGAACGTFVISNNNLYLVTASALYTDSSLTYAVATESGVYKLELVAAYEEGFAVFTGDFDDGLRGFKQAEPAVKGENIIYGYYDLRVTDFDNIGESITHGLRTISEVGSTQLKLDDNAYADALGAMCMSDKGFIGIIVAGEYLDTVVTSECIFSSIEALNNGSSGGGSGSGSDSGSGSGSGSSSGSTSSAKKERSAQDSFVIAIFIFMIIAIAVLVFMMKKKKDAGNQTGGANIPDLFNPNNLMGETPPAAVGGNLRVCITGCGGAFNGQKYEIQGELVIGRDPARCRINYSVDEAGISAVHCMIKAVNGQLELTDLESSYGTFINTAGVFDKRLEPNQTVYLSAGDSFYLADKVNTFTVSN